MTFSLDNDGDDDDEDDDEIPSMEVVKARLAKLKAMDFGWLRGVDLTPPDGGPETVGPADYQDFDWGTE